MQAYTLQIIETIVLLIIFFIVRLFTSRLITKVGSKFGYQVGRIKITNKIARALLLILLMVFLMIIWGVQQDDLLLFLSTTITILGVAFFAQWSIISNITSTLIIFFNHPIKIGDSLMIMENNGEVRGELSDIGIFFITIKTDKGEIITIPSNLFMQKMIKKNPVKTSTEKKTEEE